MAKGESFGLQGKINPDGTGLIFYHAEIMSQTLKPYAGKDCDLEITFGKVKRSTRQNRYLWGVIYPLIRREFQRRYGEDWTPQEIHAHNLQKIQGIGIEHKRIGGEDVLFLKDKSTASMSVDEFSAHIEKIKDYYAINHEIFFPDETGDNTINDFLKI